MASLRRLGYWQDEMSPEWPDPSDFIDPTWQGDERESVSSYLSQATVLFAALGASQCRICGRPNGTLDLTDGVYLWPEGLAHYVDEHAVRLPNEFVTHVLRRLSELTEADVDDNWWKSAATG